MPLNPRVITPSLSHMRPDIVSYIKSHINSRVSINKQTNRFLNYNPGGAIPTAYSLNTNFWGYDLDLTPLSVWPGIRSVTLISPQHVIYAAHDGHSINMPVQFMSTDGTIYNRTLVNRVNHPQYNTGYGLYPDIAISRLNSPLPSSISYAKILDDTWINKLSSQTSGIYVYRTNQQRQLSNAKITSIQQAGQMYETRVGAVSSDEGYFISMIMGDSSSPTFIILDNQFVLLSVLTSTDGAGTLLSQFKNDINLMMSQSGGTETLIEYNTFNFNRYNINEPVDFIDFQISKINNNLSASVQLLINTSTGNSSTNFIDNTKFIAPPLWSRNLTTDTSISGRIFSSNVWGRPRGYIKEVRFPNNAFLNVSVSELNISNVPLLESLKIPKCIDDSIDFSNNIKLKNIEILEHNLVSANLSNNSDLVNLTLTNGSLNSLQLPPNLLTLNITNNNLATLNFNLNQLNTLDCSSNNLVSLNLSNFLQLKNFSCGNNSLSNLNINVLSQLESLYCSNNSLTSLDLGGFDNLHTIDCSNNQLISLRAQQLSLQMQYPASYYYGAIYAPNSLMAQNNSLSANALNQLFMDLLPGNAILFVSGNPGAATCDASIATNKGYTVITA